MELYNHNLHQRPHYHNTTTTNSNTTATNIYINNTSNYKHQQLQQRQ